MGLKVTAAEAAALAHVSERTVRAWLTSEPPKLRAVKRQEAGRPASWAIDVDELASVAGVTIDRDMLAQLEAGRTRSPGGILARLEAVERELATVRARLRVLEAERGTSGTHTPLANTSDGLANASPRLDVPPYQPTTYTPPSAPREAYVGTGSHTFRTRADAARWLVPHGIESEYTPKSWPGWRDVDLAPGAVLSLALSMQGRRNAYWRLHRCDDSGCVCRELLPD